MDIVASTLSINTQWQFSQWLQDWIPCDLFLRHKSTKLINTFYLTLSIDHSLPPLAIQDRTWLLFLAENRCFIQGEEITSFSSHL